MSALTALVSRGPLRPVALSKPEVTTELCEAALGARLVLRLEQAESAVPPADTCTQSIYALTLANNHN